MLIKNNEFLPKADMDSLGYPFFVNASHLTHPYYFKKQYDPYIPPYIMQGQTWKTPMQKTIWEEPIKQKQKFYCQNSNVKCGASFWFVVCLISCIVRFSLEHLSNALSSFIKQQINWQPLFIENACNEKEGATQYFCKALAICLQQTIPTMLPNSPDDFWIQLLFILACRLAFSIYQLKNQKVHYKQL